MSNYLPNVPRELENSKRPLNILIGANEMSRASLEKIEPTLSMYNIQQIKPRKPRSIKKPVPRAEAHNKKECSVFNDPEVQEQLQSLILDVFGQKENEQKSFSNNECEKYSSEFEKFTNNKRESILRFPYLVDRISIKSSTSIRQSQNDGVGSLSTNKISVHNIESSGINQEDRTRENEGQSQQSACTYLCNNLMKTIDTHLKAASSPSENYECLNVEQSKQKIFNNDDTNLRRNEKSIDGIDGEGNKSDVREQKMNLIRKVTQGSIDSSNKCVQNARSIGESNSDNTIVASCTKIDEEKKKDFLHSFFGFDKILKNQSSSTSSNNSKHIQQREEYSMEQTQSTHFNLSVSKEDFHPNKNQCNCINNNFQSNSTVSRMENSKSAERFNEHGCAKRCSCSSQQISINDFPSEGSFENRKNNNYQLPKDHLYRKDNESNNLKQMKNNCCYTDNFNQVVKDEIPRSFEMNDEFFDFDPQLSFLLERPSNSFSPSNNFVEQNVYFCDVSNKIPCNLNPSESTNNNSSNVRLATTNTDQYKSNDYRPTNNSNSEKESHNNNSQDNSTSRLYDISKIENEIETRIQNQMRSLYDYSEFDDHNIYYDKSKMIYNRGNQRDKNDDCSSGAPPRKSSCDDQNHKLDNQESREQSVDSCTCSRNSKLPTTGFINISEKESNKGSPFRNEAYEIDSGIIGESSSNNYNSNQKLSMEIENYTTKCSNKAMPLSQLISLDEPDYLQHLKKLRWDHIQRISREVQRLESLERFLDSCGCGHIMDLAAGHLA
ncbi:putative uncharacterized protein DDB_G0282133 [Nilaparvata lugens]|uniref:putative uncharacterized protein DDB_G0282133 n=1 Tax=Nilaparvata lugens TaxID=108931 RepID=UPI00193D30FA|nr:putative uncharacterized protein DDB_G0282133 [Nilaparvata lugens]